MVFWPLFLLPYIAGECLYSNIDECRKNTLDKICHCPCLPKCCPRGHQLKMSDFDSSHGYSCEPTTEASHLPGSIRLKGFLSSTESSKYRYYETGFPTCLGTHNINWSYDTFTSNQFVIDADFDSEYLLHINSSVTNFHEDYIISYPRHEALLSFCLDTLEDRSEVVITCPRLLPNKTIYKCCPEGQILESGNLSHCSIRSSNITKKLYIPLNGHLLSQIELNSNLVYNSDRGLSGIGLLCGKEDFVQTESDIFRISRDGTLQFTDTYGFSVNPSAPYCVDQSFTHGIIPENYDYENEENTSESFHDYEYNYEEGGNYERIVETCHNKHPKAHQIILFYCQKPIIQIRKCCSRGEILNSRAQSCVSDETSSLWTSPLVYELDNTTLLSDTRIRNLNEMNLKNLKAENLAISNGDFIFREDRTLIYQGQIYNENEFCLDIIIDYCNQSTSSTLRAIISNSNLIDSKVGTIFGTNRNDSYFSKIFKRIGYSISSIALICVLLVFGIIRRIRQDLHGKMVIGIVGSLLCVYICLLISSFDSFPSKFISRSNIWCIIQGSLMYYFILTTFGWMSAMSYNIMTKFRARTIIRSKSENWRFVFYSLLCFGCPAVLLSVVLILHYNALHSDLRPGFGEESCWFTSCSKALSIFVYGPMCVLLLFNVFMFAYSASKLNRMRERAGIRSSSSSRNSAARSVIRNSIQKYTNVSPEPANIRDTLSKQFAALSKNSKATLSRKKEKYLAAKESFVTYLKLFMAMGLSWILEVLAWLCISRDESLGIFQYLLNLLNMLQGVVMFFVFVFKPATLKQLRFSFSKFCGGAKSVVEQKQSVFSKTTSTDDEISLHPNGPTANN